MTQIEEFVNAGMAAQTAVDELIKPVPKKIHFPTEEEERATVAEILKKERDARQLRRLAIRCAMPSLDRLASVLQGRSGQPYKLRSLLFSLWNGKPASLVEITGLDWEIRQDLAHLVIAFGYEEGKDACFYDAMQSAITKAGQWEWFLEERHNVKLLADYVAAAKEAE